MRISDRLLRLVCRWLEVTDRIRDPACGTPERQELVAAFDRFVRKTVRTGGR